jgi:tRNA(Arg) A34 adenosine deaminase TadA
LLVSITIPHWKRPAAPPDTNSPGDDPRDVSFEQGENCERRSQPGPPCVRLARINAQGNPNMKCATACCARKGRIAIGLMACALVAFGCLWYATRSQAEPAQAAPKLAALPVPQVAAASESTHPRFTREEILARFPREKHEEFMRRAIANSRKAGVEYKTGGAFGAVIVAADGTVLADGVNHVIAQNDPTWHGEMHAIRQACALLKSPKLRGCILYTSSEPCPMCLATAYWADLDGIVYGAVVADSKQYGNFDDGFIYDQLAKPSANRAISEQSLLRPEAVEVWKEYSERTDKVDY